MSGQPPDSSHQERRRTLRKRGSRPGSSSEASKRHSTHHPPSLRSRLARVQWIVLMWTPLVLLLLHRETEIAGKTNGIITTERILTVTLSLAVCAASNELLDGIQWPYYLLALGSGGVLGATIMATKDLTAARLLTVAIFGIGAGQIRDHWALSIAYQEHLVRKQRRLQARERKKVRQDRSSNETGTDRGRSERDEESAGQTSGTGTNPGPLRAPNSNASDSEGNGGGSAARQVSRVAPTLLRSLLTFIVMKLGITLWFAIGEILGSLLVPEASGLLDLIIPSWWGYTMVVVFPIATYKVSSWVSHLITLLFGTKRNIADASRMLAVYWIITAVLSLAIIGATIFFFISSWLPYVWSLQFLVAPYGIVAEFISYESRGFTKENPYKEVVEAYKEHIDTVRADKHRYFTH